MSEWLKYAGYELIYQLTAFFYLYGFSVRTAGRTNVPMQGPALIVANHQSVLDPLLVGLVTRRHLTFLARTSLFKRGIVDWFFRTYETVPIDRERGGKGGIEGVLERLSRGRAVVLFPEGTRTRDGSIRPFKPGVHLIVKRSRAPVVPVGIAGAFEAWPPKRLLPVFSPLFLPAGPSTVAVAAGKPIDGGRLAEMPREAALSELQDRVREQFEIAQRIRRK